MGINIEKFKLLERVKLSYLKHRGNVLEVANEVGLDTEYVRDLTYKFRKQEERHVSTLIANSLMQHIMLGYESRVTHLMAMLRSLEGRDQLQVSICCFKPVVLKEAGGYKCLKCNLDCNATLADKDIIYEIKRLLLVELREEDKSLVELADKMGYTNKVQMPEVSIRQNNLVVMDNKDRVLVQEARDMLPQDREKLRNELTRKLLEAANSAATEAVNSLNNKGE